MLEDLATAMHDDRALDDLARMTYTRSIRESRDALDRHGTTGGGGGEGRGFPFPPPPDGVLRVGEFE